MKKYYLNVIHVVWSCGDGCCSDGGYEAELYESSDDGVDELIWTHDDWHTCWNDDSLRDQAKDFLRKERGLSDEDIRTRLNFGDDYREE